MQQKEVKPEEGKQEEGIGLVQFNSAVVTPVQRMPRHAMFLADAVKTFAEAKGGVENDKREMVFDNARDQQLYDNLQKALENVKKKIRI